MWCIKFMKYTIILKNYVGDKINFILHIGDKIINVKNIYTPKFRKTSGG